MEVNRFKTTFANNIFRQKYAQGPDDNWDNLADRLVEDVCGTRNGTLPAIMSKEDRDQLSQYIKEMKFLPGGRYLYYAGRPFKAYNNCYLLRAEEDTREEWSNVTWRAMSCLMTGGGIGIDYSALRPSGRLLHRTGGKASGPIPLMEAINEIGRKVMQGGSRRSAIYASLNWQHEDIPIFMKSKDWQSQMIHEGYSVKDAKNDNFNYHANLDMTNISINYDDAWLNKSDREKDKVFLENCRQAMMTGEPGFSFNFGEKQNETLRNACVTGDTPILTNNGYFPIQDLVGKEVTIWNGLEWSSVTPFSTGINNLLEVHLSDGSSLKCTPYHKWILPDGTRVLAEELNVGERLGKFEMPLVVEGEDYLVDAYSQGFYSGDGNTNLGHSWLYFTKYEQCKDRLVGTVTELDSKTDRATWKHGPMFEKSFVPINGKLDYKLNWLAGLMDADGTVTRDINGNGIQICSTDKSFLLNVKLLLTTLGVRAKISRGNNEGFRTLPNGRGGIAEYFCDETFRLLIGNTDTYNLTKMGLRTNRLMLKDTPPQRDARRFVTVVSVSHLPREETFCFTDVKNSSGTFNGIVTGNCTEVTSEDDSDVCNLGSINMGNISSLGEFKDVCNLASKFLVCGTLRADLPYEKVYKVREKNRRLGLGLMGIHEWLLQRGMKYEVTPELHKWLAVYRDESKRAADEHCDRFYISHPVAYRAIAPTGSIGILASTTTGIEPLFAVSYKRRYLTEGTKWKYEYVIDATADRLVNEYGLQPNEIDTAYKLSHDYERRIKFQADIQDYVDMSISSTINLPQWGSKGNSESDVSKFASILAEYAPRLRGFTCYPDGSRGGQPITEVDYDEASKHKGVVFEETDICEISGKGGTCGS